MENCICKDITLDLFSWYGEELKVPHEYVHNFYFYVQKLERDLYSLSFIHYYDLKQQEREVVKVITSVDYDVKDTALRLDTCYKIVDLLMEYTRAYLTVESKKKMGMYLQMATAPSIPLREYMTPMLEEAIKNAEEEWKLYYDEFDDDDFEDEEEDEGKES